MLKKERIRLSKPVGGAGALFLNLRHDVYKPKCGKGSFNRQNKHKKDYRNDMCDNPSSLYFARVDY
jgi:hypothetical protein